MAAKKRRGSPIPEERPAKRPKIDGLDEFKEMLKGVYSIDFPDELVAVWDVACRVCPTNPENAFKALGAVLVGPFEVLAGKSFTETSDPHLHWRFFYDPPEFMTVMVAEGDPTAGRHWGYFRDDPTELPALVGSGRPDAYEYTIEGETLLGVLHGMATRAAKKEPKVAEALLAALESCGLRTADPKRCAATRGKRSLGRPFHRMGLVVPYNTKTEVGYRDLGMGLTEFKRLLAAVEKGECKGDDREEFDQLITFTDVANDECDFGHSLEVGIDAFCFARKPDSELRRIAARLLDIVYLLLGRTLYQRIAAAHASRRDVPRIAETME